MKYNVIEFATAAQGALADTAVQPSALIGYATQSWVTNQGYLTEIPAEYVTDSELTAKGYQTAETMRNDFLNLYDKLGTDEVLNKADYARLLVGAIIVTNQLDARIKNEQKILQGYKIDIIPKLDQINNADTTEITELAESLFKIKENVESNKKDSE